LVAQALSIGIKINDLGSWMTLNGRNVQTSHMQIIKKSFSEPVRKTMNEDSPTLSAAKCRLCSVLVVAITPEPLHVMT